MLDVIPDIHGHAATLRAALARLGYAFERGAWRHPEPDRRALFLGDYIDRGPEQAATLQIVRAMRDAGSALAIMGNHELNAIHFHTADPRLPERSLRARSAANEKQHEAFLAEFPPGAPDTRDAIAWMRTLPTFLEVEGCRAVHACWRDEAIDTLRALSGNGLNEETVIAAACEESELGHAFETTLKGPEIEFPPGFGFHDKSGKWRTHARRKWWVRAARSWGDATISVPDDAQLPTQPFEPDASSYSADAPPVFFGHYWLTGTPLIESANALCLDYSLGMGADLEGKLVTYLHVEGEALDAARITVHPHVE